MGFENLEVLATKGRPSYGEMFMQQEDAYTHNDISYSNTNNIDITRKF